MSVETPCVNLCVIDGVTGYCIGCGRTGDEIASWLGYSGAERRTIISNLADRLSRMTSRSSRSGKRSEPVEGQA